ncbi:MAG TPA: FadR family transcriptional regulator [Treponema sp.]|nr:FadR family transcriptional regulator [Treponema sp.]
MDTIKSIKTRSLRYQVYGTLKEKLLQGAWREGEKLPSEHEFCAMFGVSRVTIRAALQQLEIMGLVETKHGGGTFVKNFSAIKNVDALHPLLQIQQHQDLITVMEYRKIIEKGTVGLAVEKICPKDIEFLEKTYEIMADENSELSVYTQADLDFHHYLAQISQNSMIIKVYDLISEILMTAMKDIVRLGGRNRGPEYHRKIIDALCKSDKAECEALMEAHLQENIRIIEQNLSPVIVETET